MKSALVRTGSRHHQALNSLHFSDLRDDELHAILRVPSEQPVAKFRAQVLYTLEDRQLVERAGAGVWRITERGRAELLRLAGTAPPTEAANDEPANDGAVPVDEDMRIGDLTLEEWQRLTARREREEPTPVARESDRYLLTRSPVRIMSEADKRPAPIRRGGLDAQQWPSRRGNRLYYRDGRVTDMAGNPIEVQR